ncbi:septation regulator SpoVG [bacterium]|nr:septation regulator SpoVG [bacterium]
MNITEVRVRKVQREGKLKAFVSVTFDDLFVVHDLKVIEGNKGIFVAMPSKKIPNGEYRDIAHPIKQEARDMIQQRVLDEYERVMADDYVETVPEDELSISEL